MFWNHPVSRGSVKCSRCDRRTEPSHFNRFKLREPPEDGGSFLRQESCRRPAESLGRNPPGHSQRAAACAARRRLLLPRKTRFRSTATAVPFSNAACGQISANRELKRPGQKNLKHDIPSDRKHRRRGRLHAHATCEDRIVCRAERPTHAYRTRVHRGNEPRAGSEGQGVQAGHSKSPLVNGVDLFRIARFPYCVREETAINGIGGNADHTQRVSVGHRCRAANWVCEGSSRNP